MHASSSTTARAGTSKEVVRAELARLKITRYCKLHLWASAFLHAISHTTRPLVNFRRQRAWCLAALCVSMDTTWASWPRPYDGHKCR
jgi:hypothetical protein